MAYVLLFFLAFYLTYILTFYLAFPMSSDIDIYSWHSFLAFFYYGILSGISSDILFGILSGISSDDILSDLLIWLIFWHSYLAYLLTFFSGILSGISSDIHSGILSGISSDILSGILSGEGGEAGEGGQGGEDKGAELLYNLTTFIWQVGTWNTPASNHRSAACDGCIVGLVVLHRRH